MSMVGTFDAFTAARLGIYAAQHGLRVTGNNVANINTSGYTRQRADQVSFKVGANDTYRSWYDNHVGSGALVTSISQLRDPYLDIRYRNASTDTYHYDTWLAGLQSIASILDEVGKGDNEDGLIYRQIQDLAEKLRTYSANPTDLNDRLVRNSAASLTALFHSAATRLEALYTETAQEFNEDISAVNEILTNIRDLNKSIRESEIHGDSALEMRDERNRQIDALSQYLDIKVEYSYENVGGGVEVEKLTISLNNANPDSAVHTDESVLVDGVYATQLSVPEEKPVLNTYGNDYPYLNGYTYLKKVSAEDAQTLLNALNAGKDPEVDELYDWDDLLKVSETDEDGQEVIYYLVGTNDSDVRGIYTETNDNFTIQLGKLLNSKGGEWKNTTTAWTEITAAEAAANAKFSFPITITDRTSPLTFQINTGKTDPETGEPIINTVEIPVTDDMTDADIVKIIADELQASGKYPDYIITSNGANIIFTADPDADPAPTTMPTLSVTTEDGAASWLTVGDRETVPAREYDEHGNVIKSVSYLQVEGRWYELTIGTEYTHEIVLDDNDLHGILQAERELLTEEGEFASTADVSIDESALTKRGIPYYMKSLDLLAQKFAEAYNQLNTGYAYNQDGYYINKDGEVLTLDDIFTVDADGNISPTSMPISVDGELTPGQAQNLINNSYFLTNELGQPVDADGNLITDENGDPIGYFLADEEGYAVDKNGERLLDDDGKIFKADTLFKVNEGDGTLELAISEDAYGKLAADLNSWLDDNGYPMGGELFTQLDGKTTEGITAKTISISYGWSNGNWELVPTFKKLFADGEGGGLTNSTENDNADHMVALIDNPLTYDPRDLYGSDAIGPVLFQGSFNDMLSNMMAVEGEDASITNVRLTTSAGIMNEVDYSRESVSGVDLNDEAMNMITYQKAMSAAMRVMTVIDEMLDRLINNTAI